MKLTDKIKNDADQVSAFVATLNPEQKAARNRSFTLVRNPHLTQRVYNLLFSAVKPFKI
jgi:hypothetical protein